MGLRAGIEPARRHERVHDLGEKYHPYYRATPKYLVTQLSTGKLQVLSEGAVSFSLPTTREPWIQDPIALNSDEVILAIDPETIICLHLYSKRIVWKKSIPYPASASGEYPQLRLHDKHLLVKWSQNHGEELDCLDARTGERLWKDDGLFLGPVCCDLDLAGIDDGQIYLALGEKLHSIALSTGKVTARFLVPEIGESSWKVHVMKSSLLLHPPTALPKTSTRNRNHELSASDLNPTRLTRFLMSRYDGWMSRTLPVLVVDRADGQLLQRFCLPGSGPRLSHSFKNGYWSMTGERAYWLSATAQHNKDAVKDRDKN